MNHENTIKKSIVCKIFVLISILLFSGCAYVNISVMQPLTPLKEQVIEGRGAAKILLLNISGFISEKGKSDRLKLQHSPSMVSNVREALQKASKDSSIAGVIIKINSPGGTVTASDVIYHEIMNFKKHSQVPVYACITSLGTSGAYYIAAAADKVFAHPAAVTGSIGVIALKFNVEGLMSKLGIEEETIKSGDKKDLFSPFRELTPEEREIMQSIIDELHGRFVDIVYEQRKGNLTREELESLADGRIYTAGSALKLKLVDGIAYLDDVIAEMKTSLEVKDASVISYGRNGEYAGTIYSSASTQRSSLVEMIGDYTDGYSSRPGFAFLYLWNTQSVK